MHRSIRIGLVALLLVGVLGGSALAAQHPSASNVPGDAAASEALESEAPEAPPTADDLAHAVDRLKTQGISADAGQLGTLAGKYGLGGAIRLMAWSKSTGKTVAELSAMRDAGKGWGEIGHELGVSPGIGWIMGNGDGGNGKAEAPGQQKDHGAEADESPDESANESPDESPGA